MFELLDHALGTPLCAVMLLHSLPQYDVGISMLFTTYLHVLHTLLTYLNLRINLLTYLNLSNTHILYIYIMFVYVNTPTITSLKLLDLYFTDILINLQVV